MFGAVRSRVSGAACLHRSDSGPLWSGVDAVPVVRRRSADSSAFCIRRRFLLLRTLPLLCLVLLLAACAESPDSWRPQTRFTRPVQTELELRSTPPADVFVNGEPVGTTPVDLPFTYGRQVERAARSATHWETNPGASALLGVITLGAYLPFSVAPVDSEERIVPLDRFEGNRVEIEFRAEGYRSEKRVLELRGQPHERIEVELQPE